jgi:predicted phage-related endonuclease
VAEVIRTPIADEASWLAARRPNINASEVAALFGHHAQETLLSLYARKAGLADLAPPSGAILERGHIMEPAVAEFVRRRRPDWRVVKNTHYLHAPDARVGATPDYWVHCPERGPGVLQCKVVALPEYREKWADGAPMGYILQTAQEVMLSQVSWGVIGVLAVSTYGLDGAVLEFERNTGAEARILQAVRSFWQDVAAGRQPRPDFTRDADIIKALSPRDNGATIDLTGDNRVPELLERYDVLSTMGRHAEKELKAVKAEIAAKMGDAAAATLPGWKIRYPTRIRGAYAVKETTYRVLDVQRVEEQSAAA